MTFSQARWQLADAHEPTSGSASGGLRICHMSGPGESAVSRQVLSWMLFWPLLTLIARQAVYFAGPARSAEAYQDISAMASRGPHNYLYVNLLFLLGFVLAGHRKILIALQRNPLIPAMLVLTFCSALWSLAPDTTLRMCVQVGLCTLFACYLATRFTTEHLMQLVIFMGVTSAVLSVLFVLLLPAYGVFQGYGGNAWQGVTSHKNTLGISMVYLLSPVFFTSQYGRGRKFLYSGLILFMIAMSQSRGAWVDTAGMLAFVAWLHFVRRVRSRELRIILLMTVTIGSVTAALAVHFWPLIAQTMGKSASMSGRTGIYIEVLRSILKHPLLGYGMGGFWYPGSLESKRIGLVLGWPNIGYSESGFLELALQIGFLGVGLVIAFLFRATAQGIRLVRTAHYSPRLGWFLTILFLSALSNVEGGWFLTAETLDWVLIVVACIGMNEENLRYTGLH
jgi:exopolysaccharide production protein ExoQ